MKQFKHTPAPWYAQIDWDNTKEFRPAIDVFSKVNVRTHIASLNTFAYLGDYMQEEADANARLIAAAPELLDALMECLEGVKELNGEYQDGWDTVIEKASLIIKKATE